MAIETIVVGADSSEGTAAAVAFAAELASQLGASVIAVHAYEPLDHLDKIEPGVDFATVRERVERTMTEEWLQPLRDAGVEFGTRVAEGSPADVLIEAANDSGAGMIVAGARRLGWLEKLVLGSTSQALLKRSPVPVTIVHA